MVNVDFLTDYFHGKFDWETGQILEYGDNSEMAVVEWRFSCWRSWAYEAVFILRKDPIFKGKHIMIKYDHDPCEPRGWKNTAPTSVGLRSSESLEENAKGGSSQGTYPTDYGWRPRRLPYGSTFLRRL